MSKSNNISNNPITDLLFNTVALLLIIISMCTFVENQETTTTKGTEEVDGIELVSPPDSQGKGAVVAAEVILDIIVKDNDFVVCIDNKSYDINSLTSVLNSIGDAGGHIAIRSENKVEVGFYLKMIKLAQNAGIKNISQRIKI